MSEPPRTISWSPFSSYIELQAYGHFGDSNTGSGVSPMHTYAAPGIYAFSRIERSEKIEIRKAIADGKIAGNHVTEVSLPAGSRNLEIHYRFALPFADDRVPQLFEGA